MLEKKLYVEVGSKNLDREANIKGKNQRKLEKGKENQ